MSSTPEDYISGIESWVLHPKIPSISTLSPIIASTNCLCTLLERFGNTLVHLLHLLLIGGRVATKKINIARSYIAKDSGADDYIGCYWKAGIGRGYYHGMLLFNRARLIPKPNIHYLFCINMFTAINFQDYYKL